MTSALAVANTILGQAYNEKMKITPMKLQRLLYLLYKEYIKQTGEPLFSERFEVWQYGPVLVSIYDDFKRYKENHIEEYSYKVNENGKEIYTSINLGSSKEFRDIFYEVWNKYKWYDASYLSELTRKEGTAWRKAVENKNYILSDEDIKEDN